MQKQGYLVTNVRGRAFLVELANLLGIIVYVFLLGYTDGEKAQSEYIVYSSETLV